MPADSIRKAVVSDSAMIAHIHVESSKAGYQEALSPELLGRRTEQKQSIYWAKLLANVAGTTFLYEIEDSPVAFIRTEESPDSKICEVTHLFVLSSFWGRGIAEKLLIASRRPYTIRTELWVLEGNNQAQSFYRSKGFKPSGLLRQYDFEGTLVHQVQYFRVEQV